MGHLADLRARLQGGSADAPQEAMEAGATQVEQRRSAQRGQPAKAPSSKPGTKERTFERARGEAHTFEKAATDEHDKIMPTVLKVTVRAASKAVTTADVPLPMADPFDFHEVSCQSLNAACVGDC